MENWFSSDIHFGHENVIKYCNRPFADAKEMDSVIMENWNARVAPKDHVYFLGDFCFNKNWERYLNKLNGRFFFIFGNHDKQIRNKIHHHHKVIWAGDYKEINIEKQPIILMHYAMRVWNKSHHGAWMLYGHSHNSLEDDKRLLSIDVGVDAHDFKPINFQEVREIMIKRQEYIQKNEIVTSVDHH